MGSRSVTVLNRVIRVTERQDVSDRELLRRFATDGDQAAFSSLVHRHGAMVLSICRRALHNAQDAEDACQATFVVLAKRASRANWQPSIANWLYATARKVAQNARVAAQRRAKRESRSAVPESVPPLDRMTGRDLLGVLDEELDRLPPRYREPLVLCYLQGLTRDEAATRLGIPPATVKSQLDRGRKRLGAALTRRGVALGAGLLACVATSRVGAAPARVANAVLAAVRGTPPAAVAELSRGVAVNGFIKKSAFVLLAAIGVMAVGMGLGSAPPTAAGPPPEKAVPPKAAEKKGDVAAPSPADDAGSTKYGGSVLGPDGKPVSGAKVYLTGAGGYYWGPSPAPEWATSASSDGRFELIVSNAKFEERWGARVIAIAPKCGLGWVELEPGAQRDDLTIRLVEDDMPITGQIVDLEGRPISKATLTICQVHEAAGNDIGPWAEAALAKKGLVLDLEKRFFPRYMTGPCPTATTGADGKLRIDGIGRNRLVRGIIEGPTIASQHVCIVTRPGKPIDVFSHKGNPEYGEPSQTTTYYGSDFRLVAAPCQPIVGVVRDAATKKPIAGATVRSHNQLIAPSMYRGLTPVLKTTTDADGRYRLLGMPTGKGYTIAVVPSKDQPYVLRHVEVPPGVGVEQVTVDIDLKRGVWIEGKITDKVTGKPVKAGVGYFSRYANPNRIDFPGFDGTFLDGVGGVAGATKDDGSFRVVGLPGPGLVCVWNHQDRCLLRANDRDDEFGIKEQFVETSPYHISFTSNYNAIARVDPAKGAESVKCDVTIDPGWTFKASVIGPDGRPLAGARAFNLNTDWKWGEPMMTAEFASRFHPRKGFDIVVLHPEKGLVGTAQPPKQNGGAVAVKLQPGATATGRLVGADGKPRAGVELELWFNTKGWPAWHRYLPRSIKTDADGRFRLEALGADCGYRLRDGTDEAVFSDGLRSGEVKDLGNVKVTPSTER